MHYLLFYEKAPDHTARQPPHVKAHLDYVLAAVGAGGLVLGGSMANPSDGAAVLFFSTPSAAQVEAFAKGDPYVIHGIISRWWVRPWDTVVGEDAFNPIALG